MSYMMSDLLKEEVMGTGRGVNSMSSNATYGEIMMKTGCISECENVVNFTNNSI